MRTIHMKIFKTLILFIIMTFSLVCFNSANAQELNIQVKSVTYYKDLNADLFSTESSKPMPAVILIHGGYWSAGKRQELSDFATKLVKNGYLAMTVDYHLLPQYGQKEQATDVTNAIWWLRENSKTLKINPSKIGVVGISAGGYHVAWLATHDEINKNGIHSRPNAAVSICGPWDLSKDAEKNMSIDSLKVLESFCTGCDRTTASPQSSISSSVPPMLIIHGDADTIVPVSQSINAYRKLKTEHCNSKLVIVHNQNHYFPNTPSYFNAMDKSIKFLNKVLK